MVEMSDHVACNTIIQCLGKQKLFEKQLDVRFEIRLFHRTFRLHTANLLQAMILTCYASPE